MEIGNWMIEGWNEWRQLVNPSGWNWLNATLLQVSGEHTRYLGSVECTVVVLGLGFRLSYTYSRKTPARERIAQAMADLDEMQVTMTVREYNAMKEAADNWNRPKPGDTD